MAVGSTSAGRFNSTAPRLGAIQRRGAGGIELDGVDLQLTNVTVHGNDAVTGWGDGIDAYAGTFTITSSTITGNSATGGGGGLFAQVAGQITNSISAGNTAADGADVLFEAAALEATYATANILGQAPAFIDGTVVEIEPEDALVLTNAGCRCRTCSHRSTAPRGAALRRPTAASAPRSL
jgi:hypothetical protein